MRFWTVIPLYFDVDPFLRLRTEVIEALRRSGADAGNVRFVVVDDSAGADPEIARLHRETDVQVVVPPFNLGHQRALVHGLRSIETLVRDEDVVVTMDGDGEDRPADLPLLLKPLLDNPRDQQRLVVARRTTRKVSLAFRVMYFFFSVMFRVLTGIIVRSGNFAAYRGWAVRNVLRHPNFDLCYSAGLLSVRLRIDFVPCPRGTRYAGRSKMGFEKLIRHGTAMLMPFLDRIAVRALIASSAVFVLAIATAAVLFVQLSRAAVVQSWVIPALLVLGLTCFVALGNFVILFAVYAQSQGAALRNLETWLPASPTKRG